MRGNLSGWTEPRAEEDTVAFRYVSAALRDSDGDIVAVMHAGATWSPRTLSDVIEDIETGIHQYVVAVPNEPAADIHVVHGPRGKYLRTTGDRGLLNNLDVLPDDRDDYLPEFIRNYPSDRQTDWSENLQGVAHSSDHWFFTQKKKIYKFHVTTDLRQNASSAVSVTKMPPKLEGLECDHFGDPDYLSWNGRGYLFVPVEGSEGACSRQLVLAVFEDQVSELRYIGAEQLWSQTSSRGTDRAGWCAIDPETLLLHSSYNRIGAGLPVFRYNIDLNALERDIVRLVPAPDLVLRHGGNEMQIAEYMQGGCFSPRGHLYLLSGKGGDNEALGGIRVFDRDGTFLFRSSSVDQPFLYEYHSGSFGGPLAEEPEGITFWDVDALDPSHRPPHIEGQLHALLLDNDAGVDNFFFKHYRVPS